MNEFEETSEVKKCEVTVVDHDSNAVPCGKPTYLTLCNYTVPIPMCKDHINKLRTRSQQKERQRL